MTALSRGVSASLYSSAEFAMPRPRAGFPLSVAIIALRTRPDIYEGEFEVEYPDGTRKKCTLKFTISNDKPVSDQVLEHLASASGLPLAELGLQHGQ
jgi:hypothetical protein